MLTLTIIKPDAVANARIGNIIALLEEKGFRVRAARMTRLTREQAEGFRWYGMVSWWAC